MKNYYDILEIDPSASEAEIKAAYRRLARSCHPDVAEGESARARFDEITEAYKLLTDRISRLAYDVNLRYESAYKDNSVDHAFAPSSENKSSVSVRRKKVKSAASALFAAFAQQTESTANEKAPEEQTPPASNPGSEEKRAKAKENKSRPSARGSSDKKPSAEKPRKARASKTDTPEKNAEVTPELVKAEKKRKKTPAPAAEKAPDKKSDDMKKPAATAQPVKADKKRAPSAERTARKAGDKRIAADASARKNTKTAPSQDEKRRTPSAKLKKAEEYIGILERQLEKYEDLIYALTRCSVTPLRPEFTPSSLNLLLHVNRQSREGKKTDLS